MGKKTYANIKSEPVINHRFGKKLTNSNYGTMAFLLQRGDILKNKEENASSFSEIELTYNCIYFLIGHEQNNDSTPMHGQTQAFWSADKRNGRGAVENRTA